jgi:UDP-N-acetylglucosamine/UDP-N-acetylgalactosamine diphosphorylase
MSERLSESLLSRLKAQGQGHVLRWWDALTDAQRKNLRGQLETVDFELLERLRSSTNTTDDTPQARASRATPPRDVVRLPQTSEDRANWRVAETHGREVLAAGRVGVLLVAGGQGTRLGFPHPKGMFPVGPVSGASLFQVLAEQAVARGRQAGVVVPYYVMTSDATHDETVEFFESRRHFGLDPSAVFFFRQGNMPAVDAKTGRLLMAGPDSLCFSPDGHGGLLTALDRAGLLDDMRRRGVDVLFYHQVDNPTVKVCDPALLGWHELAGAEATTKVVPKRSADEKAGVVVAVDGVTQVIEYSDLPADVAARTDADGSLRLWCGNIAVHVFSRTFLERLLRDELALPFHVAHKQVPFFDADGVLVEPQTPNAVKFERFVFDALPQARPALVVEADRAREFNPVKNASGADSPRTAREALSRLGREWLRSAGRDVPDSAVVEIGPLFALDEDELKSRLSRGDEFTQRAYLG